jgi:hypothetical protein
MLDVMKEIRVSSTALASMVDDYNEEEYEEKKIPKKVPKRKSEDPAALQSAMVLATTRAAQSMKATAEQVQGLTEVVAELKEAKLQGVRLVVKRDKNQLIDYIDVLPKTEGK